MTIEYTGYQRQVKERIKQVIAKWTGLPHPDHLRELKEKLGDGNKMAERPYLEPETIWVYSAVDKAVGVARMLGLTK